MSDVIENTSCPDDAESTVKGVYGTADNTSEFNHLSNDGFITILDLPKCLKEHNKENNNTKKEISLSSLELKIRSIDIPQISIPASKIAYGVGSHTEGGTKYDDFDDLTIQFEMTDTMSNYWTLYKWMQMMVDIEAGVVGPYDKGSYSTTYSVFVLNQYDKPIGLYTFHGVVPVNLGGYNLDNNSDGEHLYIDFTFSYDWVSFDLREDIDN